MKELTQEYLKSILHYDPDTGIFTWKNRDDVNKSWNTKYANTIAGSLNNGYYQICINRSIIKAHRLAFLYIIGRYPLFEVDHINSIKTDNKWKNLREATKSENLQNLKKCRKDNKTGFLGVSFIPNRNKFTANIEINQKQYYLGLFNTAQEAHESYLKAKRQLHPFGML